MKGFLFFLSFALLVFSGCVSENSTGLVSAGTSSGTISIPLNEVSESAKFYEYASNGATVRFFAVKGSDGSVKTAFDACDVCYYSKKGYRQEGKYMICNNCGNRYPIDGLGTENRNPGGCWPSYLENSVVGDNVLIKKADLETGRSQFA